MRAVIREAPILILDEPSTGLDASTEDALHESLRSLIRNKTTFIIAHRLEIVREADLILVVEEGQVRVAGTHDELLEQSPIYREFHTLQNKRGDADEEV